MTLLVQQNWHTLNSLNPKYPRMLQRRNRILKNLAGHDREVSLLEHLIEKYACPFEHPIQVLDVACGMGFQVLELAKRSAEANKRNRLDLRVTGLEIDPNLCALGEEAAEQFDVPAAFQVGDACDIPFADESFDVVMSKNFFEHVYDPDLALSEQVRVLKSKGHLIIIDGNLLYPKTLFDLLFAYAVRTRGKHGGLKWLFNKGKVQSNLYGYLPLGKDEDVKTPYWWRRYIESQPDLKLIKSTGEHAVLHSHSLPILQDWMGACTVVAQKV